MDEGESGPLKRTMDFIEPGDRDMSMIPPLDPFWAQIIECWHCGGRPCEVDHEQERAVRIADMQFVRDIVSDKRDLENQVAKLLADMEATKAKEKLWELEKFALLKQIAEKEEAEVRWKKDLLLLEQEIQRLRNVNDKLQQQVEIYRRNEGKCEMLQLRLDSVIEETVTLKLEIKRLNDSNIAKVTEIEKLKKEKANLLIDIAELREKNAKLKADLDSVKRELTDLKNDTTKDDMIEELRQQVLQERYNKERGVLQLAKDKDEAIKKNEEYLITIRQLNLLISELQLQLTTSERQRQQLEQEVHDLTVELMALRRRINADKTFKKFVKIKRELNNVKDENEDLRDIVKSNVSPFPTYMKEDSTYNPAKIAQKAVEIVTGSKLTFGSQVISEPHEAQTIKSRVKSAPAVRSADGVNVVVSASSRPTSMPSSLADTSVAKSPRPATAASVRFCDGITPVLSRPRMSDGKLRYRMSNTATNAYNFKTDPESPPGSRSCWGT